MDLGALTGGELNCHYKAGGASTAGPIRFPSDGP